MLHPDFGSPATVQTYTIALPQAGTVAPEVYFAAAIFEELAYPYHKLPEQKKKNQGDGGGGGAPVGVEMAR